MAHKPGHKGKAQWQKVNKGARGVDLKFKGLSCPTWATNCGTKIKVGFDRLKRKMDFNLNLKKPDVNIKTPKLTFSTSEISVEKQLRNKNIGGGAGSGLVPDDALNIEENVPKNPITGRDDAALAQFFKYKT